MNKTFTTLLEHLVMVKPSFIFVDSREWQDQFRNEATEWEDKLLKIPRLRPFINVYSQLIPRVPNDIVVDHIFSWIMNLIDISDRGSLFPRIRMSTTMLIANKYWAFIMEKTFEAVTIWMDSNWTPSRHQGLGCTSFFVFVICALYCYYDRYWRIQHQSILLIEIHGLLNLCLLSREDWLRFEKFTDHVKHDMYKNILEY